MAAVAAVMVALGAATAEAQDGRPRIPNDYYQVAGPFSAEQQHTVEAFVDFYVNQLVNGTDSEVAVARAQLTEPMGPIGTEQFKSQYSAIVSERLARSGAMQSQKQPIEPDNPDSPTHGGPVVRMNAMIVVSRLIKDDPSTKLILEGIKDDWPGVRYWAVAAARGNLAALNAQQRQQLIAALSQMIRSEQEDEVIRVLLETLIDLDETGLVLQALNGMVKLHVGQPRLTYDAKREPLRELLRVLTVKRAQGQAVEQQMYELARAAVRYMLLITEQAQAAELDGPIADDHAAMVEQADLVLRQIAQQLGAGAQQPPNIGGLVASKNWAALQMVAVSWREILKLPPYNFTEQQLEPGPGVASAPAPDAAEPAP